MVVNEAMSEKKIVTSFSLTCSPALSLECSSSRTTGQGTYFPQDLMATFMFSNVRLIRRASLLTLASLVVPTSDSGTAAQPAIFNRTMFSISSASSFSGFSRFTDKKVRSRVSIRIPSRMAAITTQVVAMDATASERTAWELSISAMLWTRSSNSWSEKAAGSISSTSVGSRTSRRSLTRIGKAAMDLSMSSKTFLGPQNVVDAFKGSAQRWPESSSLHTTFWKMSK
mmetsp:Transcript_87968/g.247167  ORF Transcript_87968/g.247167 Transcript_87968/m.247167 type:complete len:227 (+) Transcript_87968:862-1542(+)